jgi:hypothetical protein
MAITTLDGIIAGLKPPVPFLKNGAATTAGRWYSPLYVAGMPGAAAAPSPGAAGAALTTYAGALPFSNPASGNSYLARFSAAANVAGRLRLCDRLWHNSGLSVTSTSAQTVNSAAFPARDRNGTTNGQDILIGLEVTTVMGAGTPAINLSSYTNQDGTTGKVGPTFAMPTTAAVGSFFEFPLAAGDSGVRAISTYTANATMTSGAFSLVAYRILAELDIQLGNTGLVLDAIAAGFPQLYDNTVPFLLWLPATTTAPTLTGSINIAQG